MAARRKGSNEFYSVLKGAERRYQSGEVAELFKSVNEKRVERLAAALQEYIGRNLPAAIDRRNELADYRTNPYVLLTSASVMKLAKPEKFADFLFNNKLYMGLETSFGKSIEAAFVGQYPADLNSAWCDPPEKVAEHQALAGLSNEEKARARTNSVWREVDKSCVVGSRRYLVSIKSGPNCINDTQVEAMKSAIVARYKEWLKQSKKNFPKVTSLDVVVGVTYGTDRTTNNKENQILVKLMEHGFVEEDRTRFPGVLIDVETRSVRVYKCVGQGFWSFIGRPDGPEKAPHVFLEVLIALAKALAGASDEAGIEQKLNSKIAQLSTAIGRLAFPRKSLPYWIQSDLDEDYLFWLATAMTAFFDEGI